MNKLSKISIIPNSYHIYSINGFKNMGIGVNGQKENHIKVTSCIIICIYRIIPYYLSH